MYEQDQMGGDNCLSEMKKAEDKEYLEKKRKQETQKEQMLYGNAESVEEKKKKKKDYEVNKLNEVSG